MTCLLALLSAGACSEILNPGIPAESPGLLLTGLEAACPTSFNDYNPCLAWSRDGLTLFVVLSKPTDTVLVAVDIAATSATPLANAYRVIGSIGQEVGIFTSQDPKAIFFTRRSAAETGGFQVRRMSLVDGTASRVTGAAAPDISVSPDGTQLAYHAFRSALSVDTVALIDATSGARRATTVGGTSILVATSPDGNDLGLKSYVGDSSVIWHSVTGVREPVKTGGAGGRSIGLAWSKGGFSSLYTSSTGDLSEVSATSGVAVPYARRDAELRGTVGWSPATSRVFIADGNGKCYSGESCANALFHSELVLTSPSGVRVIGSVNAASSGNNFQYFSPSPDGRWLAYSAPYGRLYLLPTGF